MDEAGLATSDLTADSAMTIYNGVLYKALDWKSLTKTAQNRGRKSIRIISAVFGIVEPDDAILKYKAKIKSAHWKPAIQEILEARNDSLIVDCRSSTYQGVWTPPHDRTVEVRVFQVVNGERSVITHMSKKYRGEFVRALLLLKNEPQEISELRGSLQQHFNFEFIPATSKSPIYLDLLVTAN